MSEIAEKLAQADSPVLITHRRADRDSLCAALGLRALLGAGSVCTPSGIEKPARQLRDLASESFHDGQLPDEYDQAVVLDAPSTERISPIDPDSVLLIDHHEPDDLVSRADTSLVDTEAGATTELVARMALSAGWEIPPDAALPLLVGLIDDTECLRDSGPQTVMIAARLFEAVDDRATVLPELLAESVGRDERIASATSVLRSHGYRAGDLFVAFSEVGAHEGTAAERLRSAGVDLAIVCSGQNGEIRVTARGSDQLADRISLGDALLPALAAEFGGDGGGHAGAGTATLPTDDVDTVFETVREIVASELGLTFSAV
jgi:nanoRNase/pAp phosphatase (c-di-AMP/oligoRNAs hydrolase)